MHSKLVVDREASARDVNAALDTHGPGAVAAFAALLQPRLKEGEVLPDLTLLVTLVGRFLSWENGALVQADEANIAEKADDADGAKARDDAAAALYGTVTEVRSIFTRRFGEDFGGALGVKGPTPSDPAQLYNFASNLINAVDAAVLPAAGADDLLTIDKPKALAAQGRGVGRDAQGGRARQARKRSNPARLGPRHRNQRSRLQRHGELRGGAVARGGQTRARREGPPVPAPPRPDGGRGQRGGHHAGPHPGPHPGPQPVGGRVGESPAAPVPGPGVGWRIANLAGARSDRDLRIADRYRVRTQRPWRIANRDGIGSGPALANRQSGSVPVSRRFGQLRRCPEPARAGLSLGSPPEVLALRTGRLMFGLHRPGVRRLPSITA